MHVSRKFWITFPTRTQVEKPIIWQMSRAYPDVSFDIRQASVQHEIGIMAVLLEGEGEQVAAAVKFLRDAGVQVDPIEKSVVEG
jgi:ABC-type methionine transport system ATPase subunit